MKLISQILLSLIITISLLLILEEVAETGLKHNRNFKLSYIQKHLLNADLLVHGPCESEWTLDPTVLEQYIPFKIYNLSLNHSDFADNYLFLCEYLKHQPKPKAVLLYVTPESFDSITANAFNSYRFSFLLEDKNVKEVVKEMDPTYAYASIIPFIKYSYYSNFTFYKSITGWLDLIRKRKSSSRPTGYVAPVHTYHRAFKRYRDLNPKEGYFLWSNKREKYFVKIIKLLKKQNISLFLYESPIYYEALNFQRNRQSHLKKIDSICSRYQIPYFRFDNLSMQYDKNNYFSTYNTTLKGNAIFNPYLGKFLNDTLRSFIKIDK